MTSSAPGNEETGARWRGRGRWTNLPDPETLAAYGDVDASYPDRILELVERESRVRGWAAVIGEAGIAILAIVAFFFAVMFFTGKEDIAGGFLLLIPILVVIRSFSSRRPPSSG